jgi:hypothetical protein
MVKARISMNPIGAPVGGLEQFDLINVKSVSKGVWAVSK